MKPACAVGALLLASLLGTAGSAASVQEPDATQRTRGDHDAANTYELSVQVPASLSKGEVSRLLLQVRRRGQPVDHVTPCLAPVPLFVNAEDARDHTPAGGFDLGPNPATDAPARCEAGSAGVRHGDGTYLFVWEPDEAGRINLTFTVGATAITVPVDVLSASPSGTVLAAFLLTVGAILLVATWWRRRVRVEPVVPTSDHLPTGRPGNRDRSWVDAALSWPAYPAVLQWPVAAAFVVLLLLLLWGPNHPGQNAGMALVWTAWWPLLPLSFLLAGRVWCALCPLAWLADAVQRVVGVRLPPPRVLRRFGPWVIAGSFLVITMVDEAWRLDDDARRTACLLLALVGVAAFFGAFFERRTFCRHVCFVGAFAETYSRAGIVDLRADRRRCETCRAPVCYHGTARRPGCPVFLQAPDLDDSGTCHLCGYCVKNCPHDAIRATFRRPVAALWATANPRLSPSVLAAILVGVVLFEQAVLLRGWTPLVEATGAFLRVDPYAWPLLLYGLLLTAFVAAPLAGLSLAGLCSAVLEGARGTAGWRANVASFGHALIPIALAGHLALGAGLLLTRSRSLPFAVLALAGRFLPGARQAAWVSSSPVFQAELALLVLGGVASLYVIYQLSGTQGRLRARLAVLPHAILVLGLLAAGLRVVATLLAESHL